MSNVRARFTVSSGVTSGNFVATLNFRLYRVRGGTPTLLANSQRIYYVASDMPYSSTTILYNGENFNIAVNETALPNDIYIATSNITTTGELFSGAFPMQVNISIEPTIIGNPDIPNIQGELYNVVDNSALILDSALTLEPNRLIPDKIKIKDFLSSLIKCFNLQLEQDKQFAKKLNIEPYNDYFGSGTEKDWTSKLDIASIDIIPMANLTTNVFKFGFQNDDDLINKDYSEKYPEVYGDYEVAIDNDFVNGTKEIKPIFAASPATRRNVTSFIGEVTYLAKDEDIPRDAKIRMVWYNGLETDNITSPTVAIRFDLAPSELYYSTSTLTNATLYGKFWAKYIDEITDKDSKMVICNMALTALDIANFKFTDNIFVDGHFFRVNKIIDFNPLSDGLTKVELLKIKSFAPLQEDVVTVYESFRSFGIIDGSKDEVRSLGATSFYNIIEGSFNNVRSITATSTIGKIDGGENII
jgi:hypothetical protein